MPAKTNQPKETSTPLIFTLVFFILLSIGLGVATYYGFAEQEKLKNDAKTAAGKETKANSERDFYRFQAWLLRAYIGIPFEGAPTEAEKGNQEALDKQKTQARDQLASDKGKFAGGQFGTGLSEERKREADELRTIVKDKIETPTKCGAWNPDQAKPATTYEDLLQAERTKVADLEKRLVASDTELTTAKRKQKEAEDGLTAAKAAFAKDLDAMKADRDNDLKKYEADIAKFMAQTKAITEKKSPNADIYLAEKEQAIKDRNVMAKELKDLRAKVEILQGRVDTKEAEKPTNARILGEIVSVQVSGKKAYINLGSADGLKPQQTFAVYALDPNGKPRSDPKASVEVVNVVKERLSEVIITTMYSKDRDIYNDRLKPIPVGDVKNIDPVVKGDVLINPTWNPEAKTHIAVAGVIDVKGDGKEDNLDAFIRAMEKQNVIVDAYIDTRDMTIKGPGISPKTELLIIGDQPYTTDPTGKSKKAENLTKLMDDMRKQATKYGLTPKKASKFLEESGYRPQMRIED